MVVSSAKESHQFTKKRLGSLQTDGHVSLIDAQHSRIMTRLHSMLESLNDWDGPVIRSTKAELDGSAFSTEERKQLLGWLKGHTNGWQCMLELQRVGSLLSKRSSAGKHAVIVDALSLMVGLESVLKSSWLFGEVASPILAQAGPVSAVTPSTRCFPEGSFCYEIVGSIGSGDEATFNSYSVRNTRLCRVNRTVSARDPRLSMVHLSDPLAPSRIITFQIKGLLAATAFGTPLRRLFVSNAAPEVDPFAILIGPCPS